MTANRRGRKVGPVALLLALFVIAVVAQAAPAQQAGEYRWYKGNVHTHSFWSDGDDFPEMAAERYKSNGYDFLSITDHNGLSRGEKWITVSAGVAAAMEKCKARFGPEWIQTRRQGEKTEVRLKTLPEVREKLAEPGKFLLIEGQEITTTVHINVLNLDRVIKPVKAASAAESIRVNVQAAHDTERQVGKSAYVQLNHPHFARGVTVEEMAEAQMLSAVEVVNFHPSCGRVEREWDIVNSLRISRGLAPLRGSATDDAHSYHKEGPSLANPGRGFVMVRASALTADAIAEAMKRGDFYASCGVILSRLEYDPNQGVLRVEVRAEPAVEYTIEFIGTLRGADLTTRPAADGKDAPAPKGGKSGTYGQDVGKILHSIKGTSAQYKLTGKELYVRASIRSTKPLANPSRLPPPLQEAYTQPVGWEKHLR